MRRYLKISVRRLMVLPLSLLVVATLAFLLVEAMPGDPATTIAGDFATEEILNEIREELGLHKSRPERYVDYLVGLTQGDMGRSFRTRRPVSAEIVRFLPNTVELALVGLFFALVFGTVIGTIGAYFRGRLPDRLARGTVTAIQSIPIFVLALGLIFVLFYLWGVLPAPVGRLGFTDIAPPRVTGFLLVDSIIAGEWATLRSGLARMVMPAMSLAIIFSAYFGKTARATMVEAMSSPEIEFARAIGLRERKVVHYGLLRARTPILTYAAILVGQLVGGTTVVELVFAWQGIGLWGLNGILNLDVPVIQGFVITAGIVTLLTYLVLDLVVIALDPRITYG